MPAPNSARVARFIFFLAVLMLSGCAGSIVSLSYRPQALEAVKPSTTAKVCVILFEDLRDVWEIGVRRDEKTPFYAGSPVNEWISRSLAEQLASAGVTVLYAKDREEALHSGADFLVSGELEELWLKQNALTYYTCLMRVTISLSKGDEKHVRKNSFSSTLSRTVLPFSSTPREVLGDCLRELLVPAAEKIVQSLR